jgi:hypothetical protein
MIKCMDCNFVTAQMMYVTNYPHQTESSMQKETWNHQIRNGTPTIQGMLICKATGVKQPLYSASCSRAWSSIPGIINQAYISKLVSLKRGYIFHNERQSTGKQRRESETRNRAKHDERNSMRRCEATCKTRKCGWAIE